VQPRTTTEEPTPRVRGERPVYRDDPQQIVGRCSGAAADAGPDRALVGLLMTGNGILASAIAARASDRA